MNNIGCDQQSSPVIHCWLVAAIMWVAWSHSVAKLPVLVAERTPNSTRAGQKKEGIEVLKSKDQQHCFGVLQKLWVNTNHPQNWYMTIAAKPNKAEVTWKSSEDKLSCIGFGHSGVDTISVRRIGLGRCANGPMADQLLFANSCYFSLVTSCLSSLPTTKVRIPAMIRVELTIKGGDLAG